MKKRIFAVILSLILVVGLLPTVALADDTPEGSGTAADPYLIATAAQLSWFRDQVNSVSDSLCATLTDDIDLSTVCGEGIGSWTSIRSGINDAGGYHGTFDGAGHTISGLYINNGAAWYKGLFGRVGEGGTVKNLTVRGTVTTSSGHGSGGICGETSGSAVIENCTTYVDITDSANYVGGVVGNHKGAVIKNCVAYGNVTSSHSYITEWWAGGIVGDNSGSITNCAFFGSVSVTCSTFVRSGGIVGMNRNGGTVTGSLAAGTVSATSTGNYETSTGGIIGVYYGSGTPATNCYTISTITNTNGGIGGTSVTADQLASGEVCWLLNGGDSQAETPAWYQTLTGSSKDTTPVPDSTHGRVYYGYADCAATQKSYANSALPTASGHSWTYSASGASLTATCANDEDHTATLTLTAPESLTYTGSAIVPTITDAQKAAWEALGLTVPTITYSSGGNVNAGSVTASITAGTGEGAKTAALTYTIAPKAVTVTAGTYKVGKTYDGTTGAGSASGSLSVSGILAADTGVTVTPTIPVFESADAGTGTITVTLALSGDTNGNYDLQTASLEVPYEIARKSITPTVADIAAVDYDGTAKTPAVTVKDGETALAATDYEVTYSNNTNAGTATVTVKAKSTGNYSFSDTDKTFTINRIAPTAADIAVDLTAVTYTGAARSLTAAPADGVTGLGTITVKYNGSADAPVNAGVFTITADVAVGTNYTAASGLALGEWTVNKAVVTVTAKDRNIGVGDEVPDLSAPAEGTDYTVTGLVGEDTLTILPTLAYEKDGVYVTRDDVDVTKAGAYDIVPSGAAAGNNYTVTYTKGTLTIAAKQDEGGETGGETPGEGGNEKPGNDRPTVPTTPSTPPTTTETETNEDGSVTTTVTDNKTGTVTATTKAPDGTVTVVETKTDGTVTTKVENPDGSTSETVENPDGSYSATIVAADGVKTEAAATAEGEVTATVTLPETVEKATVTIPTKEEPTAGTVAVIVHEDGSTTVIQKSVPTEDGLQITLEEGATIRLVDNAKGFEDVEESWYSEAVDFVSAREMMGGISEEEFGPAVTATRGMVMTILARYEGEDTADGETWYEKGVKWAEEMGISDGKAPERVITREELAVMLYRYEKEVNGGGFQGMWMFLLDYPDAEDVSDWASEAMHWMVMKGIINGKNGQLDPKGECSRAELAVMLQRFIKAINE